MPNMQGGKGYKSSKNNQESKAVLHEIAEDQQVARVIKVLGNKRMLVFCNDNTQRICRLRGALGKKTWISVGDIVLISTRDDLAAGSTGSLALKKVDISTERGDILAKYDPSVLSKLKKEYDINPKLFLTLETIENKHSSDIVNDTDNNEDYFDSGSDIVENEVHETKPKSKDHRSNLVDEEVIDIDAI